MFALCIALLVNYSPFLSFRESSTMLSHSRLFGGLPLTLYIISVRKQINQVKSTPAGRYNRLYRKRQHLLEVWCWYCTIGLYNLRPLAMNVFERKFNWHLSVRAVTYARWSESCTLITNNSIWDDKFVWPVFLIFGQKCHFGVRVSHIH